MRKAVYSGMIKKRERADQLLYAQGLAESREQAKRLIMAGLVLIEHDGKKFLPRPEKVQKPGQQVLAGARFSLSGGERYVSRGAYKLLTLLSHFQIDPREYVCLDAGASTGGFTDCLLQHGAARVYAVDVGHNQLHERLRRDDRVISLEGVNLRHASADLLPEPVDLIVADLSFISLTHILPSCLRWIKPGGLAGVLIKPQFELGPSQTVRGVVRDEKARQAAVRKIVDFCQLELGLLALGSVPAAIRGPKGNQEYMALFRQPD